jgi:16S rRNA (cytidine1402-2'-O)-methyltransferase
MAKYGTLHLIPVPLAEDGRWLGTELETLVGSIKHWIVETPKAARAQLRAINPKIDLPSLELSTWSKHGSNEALTLLQPCLNGHPMGLISDAGSPGMADPGAEVVAKAHELGITVVSWPGPSSFLLGLMSSGLNGQRFRFHGYLPHDASLRREQLSRMERDANQESQWFIETPYRNAKLFAELLQFLAPSTKVYVGFNLTASQEWSCTKSVGEWSSTPLPPQLEAKAPAIWAIGR